MLAKPPTPIFPCDKALEAFRWTAATGMQGLGFLNPTDSSSSAGIVSADGQVILGTSFSFLNGQQDTSTFVWDPLHGMRDFVSVMENEFGLANDLAGWSNVFAADMSEDGRSLVGSGTNPNGLMEAWLIQLEHPIFVPEPSTILLFISAFGLLPRQRLTSIETKAK